MQDSKRRIPRLTESQRREQIEKQALPEIEASEYISMSPSFLRQSRAHGNRPGRTPAPPFVKIGRTIRYRKKDLDAWLEQFLVEIPSVDGQGVGVPSDEGEAA